MKTILVVDDDRDVQEALVDALGDAGFAVVCAGAGGEALQLLGSGPPPDLILLDLRMPGVDGFQFRAAQLRDPALAQIPTIVLTADRQAGGRQGELRADGFLEKPIALDALLSAIERCSIAGATERSSPPSGAAPASPPHR
jgi:CheY-like chemotaxis protein